MKIYKLILVIQTLISITLYADTTVPLNEDLIKCARGSSGCVFSKYFIESSFSKFELLFRIKYSFTCEIEYAIQVANERNESVFLTYNTPEAELLLTGYGPIQIADTKPQRTFNFYKAPNCSVKIISIKKTLSENEKKNLNALLESMTSENKTLQIAIQAHKDLITYQSGYEFLSALVSILEDEKSDFISSIIKFNDINNSFVNELEKLINSPINVPVLNEPSGRQITQEEKTTFLKVSFILDILDEKCPITTTNREQCIKESLKKKLSHDDIKWLKEVSDMYKNLEYYITTLSSFTKSEKDLQQKMQETCTSLNGIDVSDAGQLAEVCKQFTGRE